MTKKYVLVLALAAVLSSVAVSAEGGFFIWTGEVLNGAEQVILPAGTFETDTAKKNGASLQVALTRSGGASKFFTNSVQYGGTTFFLVEELRFELEGDGSLTVRRTGTQTYGTVVVRGIWMTT